MLRDRIFLKYMFFVSFIRFVNINNPYNGLRFVATSVHIYISRRINVNANSTFTNSRQPKIYIYVALSWHVRFVYYCALKSGYPMLTSRDTQTDCLARKQSLSNYSAILSNKHIYPQHTYTERTIYRKFVGFVWNLILFDDFG